MNLVLSKRRRGPIGSTDPRINRSAVSNRSTESGFTLLEVIVATAIMAIAVIGLLSLISGSLANAARVKAYDRAAMLARHQMGELMVSDPLPLGAELKGNFDNASGWQAIAAPFEVTSPARVGQPMLVRIQLSVWWHSEGRRKTVEFETYRRMLIRPEHGL
jgi:general secretion pathway protein I